MATGYFAERVPEKVDKKSYDDMNWIFLKAFENPKEFKIEGIIYKLTMGVVKNVIPAVTSTMLSQ